MQWKGHIIAITRWCNAGRDVLEALSFLTLTALHSALVYQIIFFGTTLEGT